MVNKLLTKIIIPNYPDKIMLSKSRNPKYYKKGGKIPKSFLNKEKYGFDSKNILINLVTGKPHLANPRSVGTPRMWVVNFQDIWSGNMNRMVRASRTQKLKDIFEPYIKKMKVIKPDMYPIGLSIFIYDTSMPVDVSNKGVIYTKIIEDLMVKNGKIVDDDVTHINDSGRIKFVKVNSEEEKKMEVRIFKSHNLNY